MLPVTVWPIRVFTERPSGIATAPAIAACGRGKKVRFHRVTELITLFMEAHEERQLMRMKNQLAKLDLLILDELNHRAGFWETAADLSCETVFGQDLAVSGFQESAHVFHQFSHI